MALKGLKENEMSYDLFISNLVKMKKMYWYRFTLHMFWIPAYIQAYWAERTQPRYILYLKPLSQKYIQKQKSTAKCSLSLSLCI